MLCTVENVSSDYENVLHTKEKVVLLRAVHFMILLRMQHASSMASMQ